MPKLVAAGQPEFSIILGLQIQKLVVKIESDKDVFSPAEKKSPQAEEEEMPEFISCGEDNGQRKLHHHNRRRNARV